VVSQQGIVTTIAVKSVSEIRSVMIKRDDLKLDGGVHIPEWGPLDKEMEDREFAELLANKLAQGHLLSEKFTNTEKIVSGLVYQHYRDRAVAMNSEAPQQLQPQAPQGRDSAGKRDDDDPKNDSYAETDKPMSGR
jgi:hypothetical protein